MCPEVILLQNCSVEAKFFLLEPYEKNSGFVLEEREEALSRYCLLSDCFVGKFRLELMP